MKNLLIPIILLLSIASPCHSQTNVIDSLLQAVNKPQRDTIKVRTIDCLVNEFMRKDLDKGIFYAYQELALAEELKYLNGISLAYTALVHGYQDTGRLDSAQFYINEYEKLYKDNPSNKKIAINFSNTAGLFYKSQGRLKEALPYLLECLQYIGVNGDKTNIAGQLLNIGNAYHDLGELKNAATYHLKSLALFEEVKNKRGQSFCHQNLGNDFLSLEQFKVAEKYLAQAAALKEELGDARGVVTSWTSLGEVYSKTNRQSLAMDYFKKAYDRARTLKLIGSEIRTLFNMGKLLKNQKKNDEARDKFLESLALARKAGDSLIVSKIKADLVMVENSAQKEKIEEHTLVENLRISKEFGDRGNAVDAYRKMADWYSTHKQYEKAYEFQKLSQQAEDSVHGNEIIVQLKRLEEEYKSEKKEKEITLLKKDKELHVLAVSRQRVVITSIIIAFISSIIIGFLVINRYRVMNKAKRLIEIERMRNNIARDLHDDIGSTLSSINILSQVALLEKNGSTQSYLQRIGDQSTRIMEDISDMVWSINPRNDSMSQIVIRMREFATEIFELKNVDYNFTEKLEAELALRVEQRKNLFLIFKESINNAAKYSQASLVEISLQQENGFLTLKIKDNGLGFDEKLVKAGNGLRNLQERAKEINGVLTLKSKIDHGTEVEFRLPIA